MSVTISISATRTTGVAPLGVVFDASASTSTQTAIPFHEIDYSWDFGDPASGIFAISGKSKNKDIGPIAAHVFEAGNYTATLTCRDIDGIVSTSTIGITVDSADAIFAGANTICFSTSGDFTGAPAGSQQVITSSWPTVVSNIAAGKRLLLRAGETWSVTSTTNIVNNGPGILGSFGPGAKPILSLAANLAYFQLSDGQAGTSPLTHKCINWRFVNLEFAGNSLTSALAFRGEGTSDNNLFYRLNIHHTHSGFGAGLGVLDFYNGDGNPLHGGHTVHSGWVVADTTIDTMIGDGGGNCAFVCGFNTAWIGNVMNDSTAAEHILRAPFMQRAVISHNQLSRAADTKVQIKLHAPVFGQAGLGFNKYSERIVIADNLFIAEQSTWTIALAPENGGFDERVRDVIVDGNYWQDGNITSVHVLCAVHSYVTIRNNVFNNTRAFGSGNSIEVSQWGPNGPTPINVYIYNNSGFSGSTSGDYYLAYLGPGVSGIVVRNNLLSAPSVVNKGVIFNNSGFVPVQDHNQLTNTPGWLANPTSSATSARLNASSAAIDAGASLPVFKDYDWKSRPIGAVSLWDIGAFEFEAAAPAPLTSRPVYVVGMGRH